MNDEKAQSWLHGTGHRLNNITIEFMFAGINMFWARLRFIDESEKGPKHIYAEEHKLYYY